MSRNIWNVSYPVFLSLLARNVTNVVDTVFLGRAGEVELGASAMGGPYYIYAFMIVFGFSTRSQIVIDRGNGEGRYDQIGPVIIQGAFFLLSPATILFLFSRFFAGDMIHVLTSSDAILNTTGEFLDWCVSGFFFSFVNVMFRALFIGTTRTKVLTSDVVLMAMTNVLLDYLPIFEHTGFPEMGIQGTAIASVIAEAVLALFFVAHIRLIVDIYRYAPDQIRSFDLGLLKWILDISVFTMLQRFLSITIWFMFLIVAEHLGQRELAVANIVRSIYVVMLIPVNSLATTTNTSASNGTGAGTINQVIPTIWKTYKLSLSIMIVFAAVISLMPGRVVSVYTNDALLMVTSVPSVRVIAGSLLIGSVINVVFNRVSGTGNTHFALFMEAAVLTLCVLFIYVAGVCLRLPVAVCFLIGAIYYSGLPVASTTYLEKAS